MEVGFKLLTNLKMSIDKILNCENVNWKDPKSFSFQQTLSTIF